MPEFRMARPQDAQAFAHLHADSWRRHYRGAYADSFLDGDVSGYLTRLWKSRLATPESPSRTILASDGGEVIGMAHTILDKDPRWDALLDNLHVRYTLKRQGIGTQLLALTAQAVLDWSPSSGLYLWVLEQNTAAQAFYSSRGGQLVERDEVPAPGGDPARLNGKPTCSRYAWPDPAALFADDSHRRGPG
jgi:ribosomal protein S18 acetylase RimI-like enzyme